MQHSKDHPDFCKNLADYRRLLLELQRNLCDCPRIPITPKPYWDFQFRPDRLIDDLASAQSHVTEKDLDDWHNIGITGRAAARRLRAIQLYLWLVLDGGIYLDPKARMGKTCKNLPRNLSAMRPAEQRPDWALPALLLAEPAHLASGNGKKQRKLLTGELMDEVKAYLKKGAS